MKTGSSLILDQGNSRLKITVFDLKNELIFASTANNNSYEEVKKSITKFNPKNIIFSASGKVDPILKSFLQKQPQVVFLNDTTPLPISIKYKTPTTLGVDRIANVCAAATLFKDQPILTIDFGTCITYNFIDEKKCFLGGAISPGIEMRAKAMHTFTENLPLITIEPIQSFIGDDTHSCLNIGVTEAIRHEVEGFIGQYKKKFPSLKVIITGGSNSYFVNTIESSIFANLNLTATGLNEILQHNTIK